MITWATTTTSPTGCCWWTRCADDVEVLLAAYMGLDAQPLATWRPQTSTAALTLGSVPASVGQRVYARALTSLVRHVAGEADAPSVRVGLLGYGAIGHEHSRAVRAVDGLTLSAVCDTSAARLDAALTAAPGITATSDADELLARDDVDLVVISTPPSSHATWALQGDPVRQARRRGEAVRHRDGRGGRRHVGGGGRGAARGRVPEPALRRRPSRRPSRGAVRRAR